MCSKCEEILIGFSIKHSEKKCPLLRSFYCSCCSCYGHLSKDCPTITPPTSPTYLENLIPYTIRKEYDITTATPLEPKNSIHYTSNENVLEPRYVENLVHKQSLKEYGIQSYTPLKSKGVNRQTIIYMKNDNKLITKWLENHGIVVGSENPKKMLEAYAEKNNSKIYWIEKSDIVSKSDE